MTDDTRINKIVGNSIRDARVARNLTQKQLGDLCGMADSAIRRYESGRGNPTLKTLVKFMIVLDICPAYLLGEIMKNDKRM